MDADTDVNPQLVDADDGRVGTMLTGEVSVRDCDDSSHFTGCREDPQPMRFVKLIVERMIGRANTMQPDVALLSDCADDVRWSVHRARDHAPRPSAADTPHEIAHRIARPSRKHRPQRVERA